MSEVACPAAEVVGHPPVCDGEDPGAEGAAVAVVRQPLPHVAEGLGGQVLRIGAIPGAAVAIAVDGVDVSLVERREGIGVAPRLRDQVGLVVFGHSVCQGVHDLLTHIASGWLTLSYIRYIVCGTQKVTGLGDPGGMSLVMFPDRTLC